MKKFTNILQWFLIISFFSITISISALVATQLFCLIPSMITYVIIWFAVIVILCFIMLIICISEIIDK